MAVIFGQKDSPTLDLNFSRNKSLVDTLTGRNLITFSRDSIGSYTDANGVIQSAASGKPRFDHDPVTGESLGLLVEESRTNIIKSSNNFTFNDWHFTQCQMTPNAVLAPDGTQTAALIQQTNGTSTRQFICTSYSVPLTGSPWTASVYVKKFNYDYVIFGAGDQDSGSRGGRFGYLQAQLRFQFSTKTLSINPSTNWGGNVTDYGYEELPNEWFRLWVSKASFPRANYWGISVQQDFTNNTFISGDLNLITGDGVSGVYVWGLQWESGSFKTSHIPTPATFTSRSTTATYYDANGVIQTAAIDVARDDAYFPDENGNFISAGLLLEGSGTNFVTYSEEFDNAAWTKTGSTVTANSVAAPDGTTTADFLVEDTSTGLHQLETSSNIYNATPESSYTFSVFVKPNGRSEIGIGYRDAGLTIFNLSTDTITIVQQTGVGSITSNSIESLADGWYRISSTIVDNTNYGRRAEVFLCSGGSNSYAGDGASGAYVWGYQVEASPYPTSYIPTSGSTVTRAADVSTSATVTRAADVASITGTNFSNFYNNTEGTWVTDMALGFTQNAGNPFIFGGVFYTTVANGGAVRTLGNSTIMFNSLSNSQTVPSKTAVALKSQDFAVYRDGALTGSNNSLSYTPTGTKWEINSSLGSLGRIKRVTYYPTRLSNALLQRLTK